MNIDTFDWDSATDWERRQALLELRKRGLSEDMKSGGLSAPQGQMFGRMYAAPAGQGQTAAANLASKFFQKVRGNDIASQQAKLESEQQAAAADILSRLAPRPTKQQYQGVGRDDETVKGEYLKDTPAPTGGDRMAILAQGMRVPSLKGTISKLVDDQLINQPRREDEQAFKDKELQARLAEVAASRDATTAFRTAENQRQVERDRQAAADRAADRASRSEDKAADRASRRDIIAAQIEGRAANKPSKPLPNAVTKQLSELEDNAATISDLKSSFKSSYSSLTQGLENVLSDNNPFGTGSDASAWWKQYRTRSELIERHALFGASLTAGEQAAWKAASISPTMNATTIAKNLEARERLARKAFANQVDRAEKSGYPSVRDAFNPDSVRDLSTAPASAPRRKTFNPATGMLE